LLDFLLVGMVKLKRRVEIWERGVGGKELAIGFRETLQFFPILLSKTKLETWKVEEASPGRVKEKPVQVLTRSTFLIRIIFCFYYSSTDYVGEGYTWFHFAMKP